MSGYVDAGYAVVLCSLAAYSARTLYQHRALAKARPPLAPSPAEPASGGGGGDPAPAGRPAGRPEDPWP